MEIRGLNFRDVRKPDLRNVWSGFTKCVIEFLNGDGDEGEVLNLSAFPGGGLVPERGNLRKFLRATIDIIVISNVHLMILAKI